MILRLIALCALTLVVVAGGALAAVDDGQLFLQSLDAAVASGELDREQALLYEFYYGFDHAALPEAWRPSSFPPLKCGSDLMRRFERMRPTLSEETIRVFEERLTFRPRADKAAYISPLGHFDISYETTGDDAVPTEDVDPANGVPDFVDRIAGYLDTSWETEIVTMGFTAPPTHPYPISFEQMNYYGYTARVSGTESRIVLHNTYEEFASNDDPEGNSIGVAKVTCAHEFKHASQLAQSDWSEGGWVELDATWMEDVVFDVVNDYYNYLGDGSGISAPATPLDGGSTGTGSYEDCIWQHYLSETYGDQIVVDFWDWRSTNTGQAVLQSYDDVLGQYGSSLTEGYIEFGAWNLATDSRTLAGVGYEEAAGYPLGPVANVGTYPHTVNSSSAHLSSQNMICTNLGGLPGSFDVDFDAQDGVAFGLTAIVRKTDGTGVVEPIALDANGAAAVSLATPREEIQWVGLAVVNGDHANSGTWTLTVDLTLDVADPAIQLAADSVAETLDPDVQSARFVALTNTGEIGSVLNFTVFDTDLDPGTTSLPAAVRPGADRPREPVPGKGVSEHIAVGADKYAGDCVYGNQETSAYQYDSWWYGNETYALKIDPAASGCSCGVGFNMRAVHMLLHLETTSTPELRAHLAVDAGGCTGPGAIIDSSDLITVDGIAADGVYDVEIPCDFVCTDVASGPYYVLFEFLDADGPVGIITDDSPTSCANFNIWGASYEELVDGYGFEGDLMIWADVDCCGVAEPEVAVVAPNGGEYLAVGSTVDLTWTAVSMDDVKVELSRDDGGSWETLFASTPNDGLESWTVAGPSSGRCLLRIGSPDDVTVDVSDAPFAVYADVPWLIANPTSGAVDQGQSVDLIIGFDSRGLAAGTYVGWVVVRHDAPTTDELIEVELTVVDVTDAGRTPAVFALQGNNPNPFNPSTRLRFSLARAGEATVEIVDLQGRIVRRLYRGELPAGPAELVWDGRDDAGRTVGSGTYMARLSSGGLTASHKMVLAK